MIERGKRAYLSLGSNIGDREKYLVSAIELLYNSKAIRILSISSFYETEPQGYKDQDYFVNCVVQIETTLDPDHLLDYCQSIEKKLKRVRLFRWGPRTIDVDILTYGDIISNSERLIIPHPRMLERAFVLVPLAEMDMGYSSYLQNVSDQEVRRVDCTNRHQIDMKRWITGEQGDEA